MPPAGQNVHLSAEIFQIWEVLLQTVIQTVIHSDNKNERSGGSQTTDYLFWFFFKCRHVQVLQRVGKSQKQKDIRIIHFLLHVQLYLNSSVVNKAAEDSDYMHLTLSRATHKLSAAWPLGGA